MLNLAKVLALREKYCGINGAFEPIARCYISLCLSRSGWLKTISDRDFSELEARRSGAVACMFFDSRSCFILTCRCDTRQCVLSRNYKSGSFDRRARFWQSDVFAQIFLRNYLCEYRGECSHTVGRFFRCIS